MVTALIIISVLYPKKYRKDDDFDIKRRNANADAFKGALTGNLIGSDFTEVSVKKYTKN